MGQSPVFSPSLIYVLQIQATSRMPMGAEAVTLTLHSAAHAFIWKLGGKIEDTVQCVVRGAYNCHFSLFKFFYVFEAIYLICTILNNIMCHFIKSCLKNNTTNKTCKPVVSTSIQKCCQRSNISGEVGITRHLMIRCYHTTSFTISYYCTF